MVLTILSCESFAGRRLLKQQPNKTVLTVLLKTSISSVSCKTSSASAMLCR